MNEDLTPPAQQEELTLYNKDKAFSLTQKPQGLQPTTGTQQKRSEALLREKKAKRAKLLNCFVDLELCWHPHTVL